MTRKFLKLSPSFILFGLILSCAIPLQDVHAGPSVLGISSALKKIISKGLSKLPLASAALKAKTTTNSSRLTAFDVSGTPPTLTEIAAADSIENIFWRPDVVQSIVDDNASLAQCREFFSSETDGFSAGLGACHMAEGVGDAFRTILEAETSQCFMRNMPTKAILSAGGITLVNGSFPGNDITRLFSTGKSTRLVKINVPEIEGKGQDESVFVRVRSESANSKAGNLYRADLYFCGKDDPQARGFNTIQVKNNSIIKVTLGNASDPFGGGMHRVTMQGYLTGSKNTVKWDTNQPRNVKIEAIRGEDHSFKADFRITSNMIYLKRRGESSRQNFDEVRKEYNISQFSGSDALSVAFLKGAFKSESEDTFRSNSVSGAAEFRDSYYAAAPTSSLLDDVEDFDISSDSFYDSAPEPEVETEDYNCNATPNIEITMNGENETLMNALRPCFENRLERMDFCREDELVNQAQQNYQNACIGDGPPGGPPGGGGGGGSPPGDG